MLPDFSMPAFEFVALSMLRFCDVGAGGGPGPYHSEYRCQLRYKNDPPDATDTEVRVYFVGSEKVDTGNEVPVLLAFLYWDQQREKCHAGKSFELREGTHVTATGTVYAVATRKK